MTRHERLGAQRQLGMSMADLLTATDEALRRGASPVARVWPTGLGLLDEALSGGPRAGELVLLAGAQGQGKTTLGVQMARTAVATGRPALVLSYEHDMQTLMERLIALEAVFAAGEQGYDDAPGVSVVRRSLETAVGGGQGLDEVFAAVPFGIEALSEVSRYGSLLHVHESNTATDLAVLDQAITDVTAEHGQPPLVLVDYLQKVPEHDTSGDVDERITRVAEGLKNLAMAHRAPVVAITAAEKASLGSGTRIRAQHLQGSSALAYESDVLLVLSGKDQVVSREHLVYDLSRAERYRHWAILTVEKNRHGVDKLDLEFRKDFAHSRFDPSGHEVQERLIEERVFTS